MSQKAKAILSRHEVPMNDLDCRILWYKVIKAFQEEPTFEIIKPALYKDFLKYSRSCYGYLAGFFYDHDISNKEDGYSVDIAKDDDGGVLKLVKDKNGESFQYSTDNPKIFMRYGTTPEINGHRQNFYQACGVHVIYHYKIGNNGNAQVLRTVDGTKYYDENGNRNFKTTFWGVMDDLVNAICSD